MAAIKDLDGREALPLYIASGLLSYLSSEGEMKHCCCYQRERLRFNPLMRRLQRSPIAACGSLHITSGAMGPAIVFQGDALSDMQRSVY